MTSDFLSLANLPPPAGVVRVVCGVSWSWSYRGNLHTCPVGDLSSSSDFAVFDAYARRDLDWFSTSDDGAPHPRWSSALLNR